MPISSSRRRLTSPFVGPSCTGSTSSLQIASGPSQLSKERVTSSLDAANSAHVHQVVRQQRSSVRHESAPVTAPILARIKQSARVQHSAKIQRPAFRQQLHITLSDPTPKPRRKGRSTTQNIRQQGDQLMARVLSTPRDQFALKKIRFFNAPPPPAPLTLCFSHLGYDLTHWDILASIKRRRPIAVERIQHIQFVDMNVVLGTAGAENRWLITLTDHDARYRLFREGLYVNGERMFLRRYDDVNFEDYRDFLRRKTTLQSDAHTAVQRLLSL